MRERVEEAVRWLAERLVELWNRGAERWDGSRWAREDVEAEEEGLYGELERRLRGLGLEVDLSLSGDSHCYFNAPGSPRAYNFYSCTLVIGGVRDLRGLREYVAYIDYRELQYPDRTEYRLDGVWVEELPLIDGRYTPFTARLVEEVPWHLIRPEWSQQVHGLIRELARAELEGRLREAIEEAEERLRAGAWVYDYQHLYRALQRVKAELRP